MPESLAKGVNRILWPFAPSLQPCEDDLPAVTKSGFPPKSEAEPIYYTDNVWEIIFNHP